MRRTVVLLSLVACLALLLAQVASALDYVLITPPLPGASGPQNLPDLVFGLTASLGGILGSLLSIVAGGFGLVRAVRARHTLWLALIIGAAVLTILGLCVSAFVLLGLPRNPFHPFSIFLLVPLVTLVYGLRVPEA